MLLREPEVDNGNVAVVQQQQSLQILQQQQQRQQTDPTSWSEDCQLTLDANTNSLSVAYRDCIVIDEQLTVKKQQPLLQEDNERKLELNLTLTNNNNNNNNNKAYDNSPDEGLFDDEDGDRSCSSSSTASSPDDDDDKMFDHSNSDDSFSNDRIIYPIPRGIHNPNYPGFQHLAYTLQEYNVDTPHSFDLNEEFHAQYLQKLKDELNNNNNNNNTSDEGVSVDGDIITSDHPEDLIELKRAIYEYIERPLAATVDNIGEVVDDVIRRIVEEHDSNGEVWTIVSPEGRRRLEELLGVTLRTRPAMEPSVNNNAIAEDAYMSDVIERLPKSDEECRDSFGDVVVGEQTDINSNVAVTVADAKVAAVAEETSTTVEKPEVDNKHVSKKHAKKLPEKSKSIDSAGEFDVYNIETAMPVIDLDAIENHLRAAREEERRRRYDREEIRRRLAMGTEHDEYYASCDRPGRKPSLQSRLQSGMNLQICFMNETASDTESPSDAEATADTKKSISKSKHLSSSGKPKRHGNTELNGAKKSPTLIRPSTLSLNGTHKFSAANLSTKLDFFECQARLQTEARMALAQAKEIAHMQMEAERLRQNKSPITEMLRCSLRKAGIDLLGDRRRVSRQMLTDINIAQLQIIVNELHTQIERLNEVLVEMLIARDELHMSQDSMLVDIEDLTRHLSAKDVNNKTADAAKNCERSSSEEKSIPTSSISKQNRVSLLSSSMTK